MFSFFLLNESICNNSNWTSITVQSISLSVSVFVLPKASPTSVSVKLLTSCQLWRRAYLDLVDGWVLVDLSHANIFSESAEKGATWVSVTASHHPNPTHTRSSIHGYVPGLRRELYGLLTPGVFCLDPDGWSTDPTIWNKPIFPASVQLDPPCPQHHYVFMWGQPVRLTNQ